MYVMLGYMHAQSHRYTAYFQSKQLLNAQPEAGPLREGCEAILGAGKREGQEVEPRILQ